MTAPKGSGGPPTEPGVYWAQPVYVSPPQPWRPMRVCFDPDEPGEMFAYSYGSATPWELNELNWGDAVRYANSPNESEPAPPTPDESKPLPGEVSTAECSEMEIAWANAEGRMRVTKDGLGFIRRPAAAEPALPTDGPTHVVHHVTCPVHEDQIAELRRAFASLAAHYIMRIGGEYAAEEDAKFAKLVEAGHPSREDCDAECGECSICAWRDCEFRDVMHYHHDGCPSCDVEVDAALATQEPPAKEPKP